MFTTLLTNQEDDSTLYNLSSIRRRSCTMLLFEWLQKTYKPWICMWSWTRALI